MENKIVGLTHYKNAWKFKNSIGVMAYAPANSRITDQNNNPWLSPPLELAKKFYEKEISFDEFRDGYHLLILKNLDAQDVLDELVEKHGPSLVLCGYQWEPAQCHRPILGDWINTNTTYVAKEVSEQCDVYGLTVQEYLASLKKS